MIGWKGVSCNSPTILQFSFWMLVCIFHSRSGEEAIWNLYNQIPARGSWLPNHRGGFHTTLQAYRSLRGFDWCLQRSRLPSCWRPSHGSSSSETGRSLRPVQNSMRRAQNHCTSPWQGDNCSYWIQNLTNNIIIASLVDNFLRFILKLILNNHS